MNRKTASGIMLTLLCIGMSTLAFDIQLVKASETIYIKADGNIEPPTAPILRDVDLYTLTDDIFSDMDGIVIERNNMTLDGVDHTLQGSEAWYSRGVSLTGRSNVTIKDLTIKEFTTGIQLDKVSNNDFYGNNVVDNWYGITLEHSSSNNSIYGNNVTNNKWWGINLYESSNNNSILRNNVTDNEEDGISLDMSSSNNSICGNNVVSNRYGIRLWYSPNNSISENNVTSNEYGIYNRFSSNNNIAGNFIANNENGIQLIGDNNLVSGNNVTDNLIHGMYLWGSNNRLRKNILNGNNYNFGVGGSTLLDFINDVDVSNVVDGKPVYYCVNRHNEEVPSNAGFVGLVNCTGITVGDATLKHNWEGVLLVNTSNTLMQNLEIRNNFYGIYLEGSFNNGIRRSTICNNQYVGMWIHWSTNNIVSANFVKNNSNFAMMLSDSSQNKIFHNNFINNDIWSFLSTNVWDDGYPSGGNYWSDYIAKGGYDADGDGIGDIPYVIDYHNQDSYPLMEPWTLPPRTMDELKIKIEELGSEGEIDNQGIVKSLLAKLNAAQKLVDKGKIDEAKSIFEEDFIPQVQSLTDKHITPEAADILIESAEYIISHL